MEGHAPCGGELWAALANAQAPTGEPPKASATEPPALEDKDIDVFAFDAERREAYRQAKEREELLHARKRARALEATNEIARTAELIDGRIYLDLEILLGPIVADSTAEFIAFAAWARGRTCHVPRRKLRAARDIFVRAATDRFDDLSVFVTDHRDELRLCFRWNRERSGLDLYGSERAHGATLYVNLDKVEEVTMSRNKKGKGNVQNLRSGRANTKSTPRAAGERFVEPAEVADAPEGASDIGDADTAPKTAAPNEVNNAPPAPAPETAAPNAGNEAAEPTAGEPAGDSANESAEPAAPSSARDAWASVGANVPEEDPETQARTAKRATVMEAVAYLFAALGKPVPAHLADPQAILDRADAGSCPLCAGGATHRSASASPSAARPSTAKAAKMPADRSEAARRAHETRRRKKEEALRQAAGGKSA